MGRHERKTRDVVEGTLKWFRESDFAISEISKESGIHIATFTGKLEGKWNPPGETLIKLAKARDALEKRERDARRDELKSIASGE